MSTKKLIDPIDVNLTGNTDYQNLFIYVDMSAKRRGSNVLSNDTGNSRTLQTKSVNLLGYKQNASQELNNNIFTTDYTLIYDNNNNNNDVFEGFGIKSINIETNASYVPKVIVEFVDIKGMSFFNKDKQSPYSILFDFPPPIFSLKIKGYYGNTLEYKLHLLRHNTTFESDTGNFNITAEFVGNTFAPLADILFQNVLLISKIEGIDTNISANSEVRSLQDLISRSKTIKSELVEKIKDTDLYSRYLKKGQDYNNFNDYVEKNLFDLIDNNPDLRLVVIYKNNTNVINSDYKTHDILKIREWVVDNNVEYYIINKPTFFGNNILYNRNINSIYDKLFKSDRYDFRLSNIESYNNEDGILTNIRQIVGLPRPNLIKIDGYNKVDYINITETIKEIKSEYNILDTELKSIIKELSEDTQDIVKTELGFVPTIKNVMNIICNDIDKWLNKLCEVYNQSSNFISNNKEQFDRKFNDVDVIYPFPDFIDNGVKIFPIDSTDIRSIMPEVKFTKDFITNFIDRKNEISDDENSKIDSITSGELSKWYPTNYYNSITNDNKIRSPYYIPKNEDGIIKILFARYYTLKYFTFYNNNIDNVLLKYFFESELKNILLSVTDNTLKLSISNKLNDLGVISRGISNVETFQFNGINLIEEYKILVSYISRLVPDISDIKNVINENNYNINNQYSGIILNKNIQLSLKESFDDISLDGYKYIDNNKNDYYKIKKRNISSFGITMTNNNDIYYYDGNNENNSSFINIDRFNRPNPNLEILNFNSIIYKSILANEYKNKINEEIINNSTNNHDILFGIINIIYYPNLRHINNIFFNKSIISDIPYLIKIFISSYIYDIIENNEINYLKIIGYNTDTKFNSIRFNFLNPLEELSELINNLVTSDINKFIQFYNEELNNDNFNKLNDFINKFIINDQFISVSNDEYKTIIDDNINSINFIKEKSLYINVSDYTFKNKINNDITDEFINDKIKSNFISDINNNFLKEFDVFGTNYIKKTKDVQLDTTTDDDKKTAIDSSFYDVKLETYYSLKSFVDRWMIPIDEENNTNIKTIFGDGYTGNLIDLFSFVDRTYNSNTAEDTIVDITILSEFENDYNINMLTVIGKLLNENGFEFYPLQNFMAFNKTNSVDWDENNIFRPMTNNVNIALTSPRFTCIYVGGTSKYLDSINNANSTFKNDGISIFDEAEDFNDSNSNTQGFRVRFGDGRQSVFKKIHVSTEEFQPTNESLEAMSIIMDSAERTPVPTTQNLYTTYEQRSYMCKVEMFGNAMIQPTQFFMLENIPMFNGLYLILKVTHLIDGESNSMSTTFEGVRLPKEPRRFITSAFDVYVKNILKIDTFNIDSLNISERNVRRNDDLKFDIKDRTIFLLSGDDKNNTNAVGFYNNKKIFESDYTKEFRGLLKNELDRKSIKNDIDNDNLSLNDMINELNSKIKSDDIVIDIRFIAKGDNINGSQVSIKNNEDVDLVNLATTFGKIISDTLSTDLINNNFINLNQTQKERFDQLNQLNTKNIILIEICHIDNVGDITKYEENKELLARNLVNDILSKISVTENDKKIINLQTYNILNELKYSNINNRVNPYDIPNVVDLKNKMNSLFKNHGYSYNFAGSKISYISNTTGPFVAKKPLSVYGNNNDNYFDDIIKQLKLTAEKSKIDVMFLFGIVAIESALKPSAVSTTGAFGIGQFILTSAMSEVLRLLQSNPNTKTKILVFENNSYIEKEKTYNEILNILFNNNNIGINFSGISGLQIRNYLVNTKVNNKSYADIFIQNIFDNPFICIEFVGIYLNILENYVKTRVNKNLGVLSLSYNAGNIGNNYNNENNIYFNYVTLKYKTSNDNQKIQLLNEGIKYPERLLNEILIPLKIIDSSQPKSNILV